MSRRIIGPFNRVEGDLEVALEIVDGRVDAAFVSSPLYRGFEQILVGKVPADALVLVPRICGICSVAQSAAAAAALASLAGLAPAANGRLAANLTLATENLLDHLSHFYLFFMPDFARADYAGASWHAGAVERFKAMSGRAGRQFMAARHSFARLLGLLAGKWPHTLALQPGGSTRPLQAGDSVQLAVMLSEFRGWLEDVLFGDRLEAVAELDSLDALWAWSRRDRPAGSDFGRFLHIAEALELWRLGRAGDIFMSHGAYELGDGGHLFRRGVWSGSLQPLDVAAISEDSAHAWLASEGGPRHPGEGDTRPRPEKADAYTWCKAPRLGGQVVEVGALARQLVDGHALARDVVGRHGGNVLARIVARMLEVARVLPVMEAWAAELRPGDPFCRDADLPGEGAGVGLVEAARGSLGHWLSVDAGKISRYQIIAPTTWNFSPRDSRGQPGALEQALVGLPVGDTTPPAVHHIVRSFDPCMVCTVH